MRKHSRPLRNRCALAAALLAAGIWLSSGQSLAGKGKPGGGGGGSAPTGTIYFRTGLQYGAMAPDGSGKTPLPLFDAPGRVAKEPSVALHGDHRWFLDVKASGILNPDGSDNYQLYAVRDDGSATVLLTTQPTLDLHTDSYTPSPVRWAVDAGDPTTPLDDVTDGVVSWVARRWENGQVVQAGLYAAYVVFDASGNVSGLWAQPDGADPLIDLDVVVWDNGGVTYSVDIVGFDWSPDGTALVFGTSASGLNPLFIFDTLTSQEYLLTVDGGDPVWSPDGTQIAFRSFDAIEKITPDGTGRTIIVSDSPQGQGSKLALSPRWSPTGTHLIYQWWNFATGGNYVNRSDVYRVNADGSGKKNLTSDLTSDTNLVAGWR